MTERNGRSTAASNEGSDVGELLTAATSALHAANEEVARCQASERRLQAILTGVLEEVPLPIVVVDAGLTVQACSDAARAHALRPGGPVSGPLARVVTTIVEQAQGRRQERATVAEGWHGRAIEAHPAERQVLLWRDP